MKLKTLDAFEVNYVDSAAKKELKIGNTTGTGEKRIYVGHDEARYDEFFEFDNVEYFFTFKEDLLNYLEEAKDEYCNPTQEYGNDISTFYNDNLKNTKAIPLDQITFEFRKKYDGQRRYFVVLNDEIPDPKGNREKYQYINDICLPRVTKIYFAKLEDPRTKKKYIYLKPIFFNNLKLEDEVIIVEADSETEAKEKTIKYRKKQAQYRKKVLDAMPMCPFTNVTDDRLLMACHIKPFRKCTSDQEKYDKKNGITMTPTYHALFDLGFISFKNNGDLMVSPFISKRTQEKLNIKEGMNVRIQNGSDKYLEYHRDNIFNSLPDTNDM